MTGKKRKAQKMIYKKPVRIFEDSGAVIPQKAYYVRLDNVTNTKKQDIKTMIDESRYFSMFAPRQSGKTTFLERICRELHQAPTYIVIFLCFQNLSKVTKKEFYREIEKELYTQLKNRLREVGCEKCAVIESLLESHRLTNHLSFMELFEELNRVMEFKKIVIFIDEFDGIPLEELENFLTTLRSLYQKYKSKEQKALYSIGLIGIRNITKLIVGGVSPFNIADQVDLPPFSLRNVHDLFSQYTEETNQPFSEEAVKKIYEETEGQPWLVNRLGTILTVDVKPETVEPIEKKDVEKAIEILLLEKNHHFDNLYEKAKLYKETFVEVVFDNVIYSPYQEDQSWLEQYGLLKNKEGHAIVANNIYKSMFTKVFFREVDAYEEISLDGYVLPGNRLDMEKILLDFEQYIAQIGVNAFYKEDKPYEKTGQFLLTAWLYQFVRGGAGELRYEVPSGVGRMDIILIYKGKKYIIETKINRHNLARTIKDGINQLSEKYLASEFAAEGFLLIFDIKTPIGEECEPLRHQAVNKEVTSFAIGIGRTG
jgi:hypothetical protein